MSFFCKMGKHKWNYVKVFDVHYIDPCTTCIVSNPVGCRGYECDKCRQRKVKILIKEAGETIQKALDWKNEKRVNQQAKVLPFKIVK